MVLRIDFDGRKIGREYSTRTREAGGRRARAFDAAAKEVMNTALEQARANISRAGNFGSRWTRGLQGVINNSADGDVEILFTHTEEHFNVFQYGATIRGQPMLWIPLSFATDAKGVFARDYPGGLFRVDRKGGKAPLLLSRESREPKYFGKEQVRIPKKFRVIEIIRETARTFKSVLARRQTR